MHAPLVTADWLAQNIETPKLLILDASPASNLANAEVKHPGLQIIGARPFNLKETFSDKQSDLPNMMPPPDQFTTACQALGIDGDSQIVIYDNLGLYASPRAWWMLKAMGHEHVAVLDGGLNAWIASGGRAEAPSQSTYAPGDFIATYDSKSTKNAAQVVQNLTSKDFIVLDARSRGRFHAQAPEPRATSRAGHIPGSYNLPFSELCRDSKFLPIEELKTKFEQLDLDDRPLVFSCGSGLTACVTLLAATLVLGNELAIYDGSWSEWGDAEGGFPIVNGTS